MEELEKEIQEQASKIMTVNKNDLIIPNADTKVGDVIKEQENVLLQSEEVNKVARQFGEERIKSDLKAEASRIRRKNIETAEKEFESETRELRLIHLKAEMNLEHRYNMETLTQDAKHNQMLDARKKLVEKYGYLYDMSEKNIVKAYDSKGNVYDRPKDFCFSKVVNAVRKFGRDVSKLDKPILQTIKWLLIFGFIGLAIFLLKKYNIL